MLTMNKIAATIFKRGSFSQTDSGLERGQHGLCMNCNANPAAVGA